jgi:hypothetical protein
MKEGDRIMNTITVGEIMELYKKCGLSGENGSKIRTTINTGTMSNKLNATKPIPKGENESRLRV